MKKLFMTLLVLVVVLGVVGVVSPTDYALEKSIVIDAPPAAVHAYVGDLRKWEDWAPWFDEDPSIVTTYSDTTTGVGAHQSWTSEGGDGELTLTKCDAQTGIAYDMSFIHEGESTPATSAMTYEPVDGGTKVTWSMEGDWEGAMPPVIDGLFNYLSDMMIGGMFDQGLANLKAKVEASA